MKTETQITLTPHRRQSFTARTAIASLALATATIPARAGEAATTKEIADALRPLHINVPKAKLTDLRKRINATKWPERELVTDASQGVQLGTMQKLADYWAKDYNWRKIEARLNALPQFTTKIDGVDIHFIHVRSKHPNALPLIITHGWPGSIIEELKVIDPLTNPTAYGGSASDAVDLVLTWLPGYCFSGEPPALGWEPVSISRGWFPVMKRLWYKGIVS